MCGLLGILATDGKAAAYADAVTAALPHMRHRGPDEHLTWHNQDVVFGFTRLSIIDIKNAHQPMVWGTADDPERYILAFNGEIYNYVELREELQKEFGAEFHTTGDGEPIVVGFHYWGEDVITRLRGMFAFLIWDTKTRTLFMGRDPFGIKPLYYCLTEHGAVFGSEKKCLLSLADTIKLPLELDKRALEHYVAFQYVPEPESLHTTIRRLESGCCATLAPGGQLQTRRYFTPTFPIDKSAHDHEQALIDGITAALEDSVAKHMRADVTVGSFLSGGIDSTAIAALAKRHNDNLLTFTTGFHREGYSEIDVAAESAKAIGVEHIVKPVTPEEFVAREARKHVKVVLSGEGADELFGGYTIYKEPLSLAPFEKIPGPLRRGLGSFSDHLPHGMRGKSLLKRGSMRLEDRYYGNARSFTFEQMHELMPWVSPEWDHQDVTADIYAQSVGWDPVARMQHIDMFTWLRGDILVKADRITMANSLELRVPFLDKVVWEAARKLPYDMKITHGTSKWALREALKTIVPPHVLNRKKLGFPVPIRHWLAGPEMYDWARTLILESEAEHLFDKTALLSMLDEHKDGVMDHSRRIWTMLCFIIWHGIFVEDRIHPEIPEPQYPVEL